MDLRYKFELERKINELSSRRRALERQYELRASTANELALVKQESTRRLCEAIEAQNVQAAARNQALREQMYTTVNKTVNCNGKSEASLKAAKEQYLKHVEASMPYWHRHQTIKLEEKLRAIQLEKAQSEQRKQQLRAELQRENEVKQQLERHRQELMHSLNEEQRLILEAQAKAILLEEQSKAMNAQMVSELELASLQMKEAVYTNVNELRERANAATEAAALARYQQPQPLPPYVRAGDLNAAYRPAAASAGEVLHQWAQDAGVRRSYPSGHSAGEDRDLPFGAYPPPAVHSSWDTSVTAAQGSYATRAAHPAPGPAPAPRVSWHQDTHPQLHSAIPDVVDTERDEPTAAYRPPYGRGEGASNTPRSAASTPRTPSSATAAPAIPPVYVPARSPHSQLFDAVSESQSLTSGPARDASMRVTGSGSQYSGGGSSPASTTAGGAVPVPLSHSLYIQTTSTSEVDTPLGPEPAASAASGGAVSVASTPLEESHWHNPFPRSPNNTAGQTASAVPDAAGSTAVSPHLAPHNQLSRTDSGSASSPANNKRDRDSRSEFSFNSGKDTPVREPSVLTGGDEASSRMNTSWSEGSAGGGSSKGIDLPAMVQGLTIPQCGTLVQLLAQAIERRVTQNGAQSVSVTAVYDTQTRHRAAHIIDAFVTADGVEDAGLSAVLNNAADSTLGNAMLAIAEGKSSILIPR